MSRESTVVGDLSEVLLDQLDDESPGPKEIALWGAERGALLRAFRRLAWR